LKLSNLADKGFDVQAQNHAKAILVEDFQTPLRELCKVLSDFRICDVELIRSGGGEASLTQRLRQALERYEWKKRKIKIVKTVDDRQHTSTTHEIDHIRSTEKGLIALEIEWNNKDPFFDRDLQNFQRLHVEGAISVGIIITRGKSFQDKITQIIYNCALNNGILNFDDLREKFEITPTSRQKKKTESQNGDFVKNWAEVFVADKFGSATTHWSKLQDRIERGVGNPCPLLLIGIPDRVVRKKKYNDKSGL